ncbi:MurR/RpiR family transcriptional regulator [Caloramator sp. E03]|uniref:MurR/RpiR family transcriptional regulator n=1 Tax=Caloramator sp. E03 TaxID=2576307 RepID=UPI001110222F|nr:MurR/RpiR family transcriptional regulator [Caloramator sp. E03]QCX34322.1 MurR/RpiR family transcriptional regulator [Caloramator sp. E03]
MPGDIDKIKSLINNMKPSERKIAEYIINNTEKISDLSIVELAKESNTSEASIVRFCKTMGYKGYQDMKIKISVDFTYKAKSIQGFVNADDSVEMIISKISKNNMQSIEKTMNILDKNDVERAAEALINARKINFYGVGASAIVAQDAMQKFTRINEFCTAYNDIHLQLASASNLTNGDVAVGISYSGRTSDTVDVLKIAKNAGATTICITKFGNSPITEVSDIKLFIYSTEAIFRSAAMASRIVQMNVIDILFSIVACRKYDKIIKYLENTSEAVSSHKYIR